MSASWTLTQAGATQSLAQSLRVAPRVRRGATSTFPSPYVWRDRVGG